MLRRFGPFNLFLFTESDDAGLESTLEELRKKSINGKSRGWKILRQYWDNLAEMARWVYQKRHRISDEFPRTKSGLIIKNRHVLIKQYANSRSASPQCLSSKGFEESNYRLVVSSNAERALVCRYSEYPNLTGALLSFRDEYPHPEKCDICGESASSDVCSICGQWYCQACSFNCLTCERWICVPCSTAESGFMSAYEWYFHRD